MFTLNKALGCNVRLTGPQQSVLGSPEGSENLGELSPNVGQDVADIVQADAGNGEGASLIVRRT